LSKIPAGIVAILGISFIAMPTGILASAFSDALAHQRAEPRDDSPKT
jgi:voltage-gated potassium channel